MNTTTLPPVASYQGDYQAIIGVLNDYFDGLYHGNVEKLRSIFHEDAVLKGNEYRKTRDEWLDAVANRPVPREEGMGFDFNILSLEIVGDQAMAKVEAPLLAAHFIDATQGNDRAPEFTFVVKPVDDTSVVVYINQLSSCCG